MNNAFFTLPIQYFYEVALDKCMMDADIKLFLMSTGYKSFEELTAEELNACFEYAEKKLCRSKLGRDKEEAIQ